MNTSFQIMAGVCHDAGRRRIARRPVVATGGPARPRRLRGRWWRQRHSFAGEPLRRQAQPDRRHPTAVRRRRPRCTYRLFLDRAAPFVEQPAARCNRSADAVRADPAGRRAGGAVQGDGQLDPAFDALGMRRRQSGHPLWATSSRRRRDRPRANRDRRRLHFRARHRDAGAAAQRHRQAHLGRRDILGAVDGYQEADAACGQEAHDAGLAGSFVADSRAAHRRRPYHQPPSAALDRRWHHGRLNVADLVNCTKGPSGRDCLRAPSTSTSRQPGASTDLDRNGYRGNRAGGFAETCTSGPRRPAATPATAARRPAGRALGHRQHRPCNQIRYLTCLRVGGTVDRAGPALARAGSQATNRPMPAASRRSEFALPDFHAIAPPRPPQPRNINHVLTAW